MSGHSKWKKIKHQKGTADQKRGRIFSKLLAAISVAAKGEPNPQFNPRLRAAIEKAKENKVPFENIDRAIKHSSEEKNLEEAIFEAYGPEGAAILIVAITNNTNRSVSEIKKILSDNNAKWAEPGSVKWAFEQNVESQEWQAKFPQEISSEAKEKLRELIEKLEDRDDVQGVYVNTL
ncbi:YebC/PmpR family DNA-binding transcriptional regulator [Candidatus Wolfebacteria bacterium]|nr:YebC/PmpR family DNA-binding transcriptional regulator [Candidatus Wolfebacteria bacterium]